MSDGTLTAEGPSAVEDEAGPVPAADDAEDGDAQLPPGDREPEAAEPEPEAAEPEPEAAEPEPEAAEPETGPGPGDALGDDELLQAVAALVFASPEPLGLGRLCALLERPASARVRAALDEIAKRLAASGLPLELRSIAGGWQILTRASMGAVVARLCDEQKTERISAAALETLAIVAYRQPVTKAEIEAIRGVQAGPILRSLVDRGLVRVTGRADQPGHALQYATTKAFLDRFGLASLTDLPRDGELTED